jgi:hypothetical protein
MKLTDGQAVTLQARVTGSSPVDSAPSYQSGLPQFDWGGFGRGRPSSVWVVLREGRARCGPPGRERCVVPSLILKLRSPRHGGPALSGENLSGPPACFARVGSACPDADTRAVRPGPPGGSQRGWCRATRSCRTLRAWLGSAPYEEVRPCNRPFSRSYTRKPGGCCCATTTPPGGNS